MITAVDATHFSNDAAKFDTHISMHFGVIQDLIEGYF